MSCSPSLTLATSIPAGRPTTQWAAVTTHLEVVVMGVVMVVVIVMVIVIAT